ncbi:MAG: T9SS type A sorting domain-containing protein [Fulvivirga sp.]|uniref:T9SS type A sorting domain-containing protein n=1 Tax=Fulvivirga sp. TaxID=1931237 RepID=UPI0032EA9DA7
MKKTLLVIILSIFVESMKAQVTATCTPVDITCGFSQGGTRTGQFSNECLGDFSLNADVYETTGCVSTVIGNSDTFQIDENVKINGDLILNLNAPGSIFEIISGVTFEITGNLVIVGNSNQERQLSIEGNLIVGGILDFGERGGGTDQDVEIDGNGSISAGSINNGGNTTCDASGTCPSFNVDGSCEPAGSGLCTESALPIELAYFYAQPSVQIIELNWSTYTEINNDYFSIEKSIDGINYSLLTTVNGAGNSIDQLEYSYTDKKPSFGRSYYRLKQTDFDGTSETFSPVAVDFTSLEEGKLVFTNPAKPGGIVTILTTAEDSEVLTLLLVNILGETIISKTFAGSQFDFTLNDNVKPGLYFVKVFSATTERSGRLIVQ